MPRDGSGNYTLPPGNPVVDGTVIDTLWANPTLADIALQLNNVITRDGLLGPTAPVLFADGTVALPGISWSAQPSLGFYRPSLGRMSVAAGGFEIAAWTSGGYSVTTGDVTVAAGNLAVSAGNATVAGTLSISAASVGAPGLWFTGDASTGIYGPGGGQVAISSSGVQRVVVAPSNVQIKATTTASSPSFIIGAGTNAVGPGYAIDMLGSGVGTDETIVRWLNNAYSIERLVISTDSAAVEFTVPGALPMNFYTTNVVRFQIAAGGIGTYTGIFNVTGAHATAPNFWVGETAAAAGTVGISSSLGASIVFWGNSSAGAGAMNLVAGGATSVVLDRVASAVNYFQMTQSSTGNALLFASKGSDANVTIAYVAQGQASHAFYSNSTTAGQPQFAIQPTLGSTRNLIVTGSAAGNPQMTASAGLIQFGTSMVNIGSAAPPQSGVGTTLTYASSSGIGWITPGKTANNRVTEFYNDSTGLHGRWVDDAYTSGLDWMTVTGGQSATTTGINFALTGSFTIAANSPGPTSLGLLILTDTGAAGVNIKLTGDGGTTPKKFVRVTGGAFQILNDGYSAALLSLSDAGVATDIRGLPFGRDPGATASAHAIGSIVMAQCGTTTNALSGTRDASATNLTVYAIGPGSNATINTGTWRCIGARDSSTTVGLWIRIS
jgi:hypothetical protein